jgi:amidophosphoribosyltransferase
MNLHEECGVLGIFSKNPAKLSNIAYYGLYAIQHRGQESCGIVINDDGVFTSHKDLGLISDVFSNEVLNRFPDGKIAVGHVRYATTGKNDRHNCQPIIINHQKGKLAISHNGNLANASVLRNDLELSGAIFHTTSDTETIAYIITKERLTAPSIEDAVSKSIPKFDGAFSLCIMSSTKLIAVRDPYGFRPLCYGKTDDDVYVVASESCALNAVGATFIRDLLPGEMLVFSDDGIVSRKEHCNKKPEKICIFEYIYFARPDSVIDGVSVHMARIRAGEILAKIHPVDADVVVGVPDSGLDAALGFSKESGIPYETGLIKNKYIGRTFIAPGQDNRLDKVKIKLNAVLDVVKDKRVVLIDDSIVRGTTCGRIVKLLRDAGAKEIHMRVSAPPFLNPCYYGTDIDSSKDLIANNASVDEIAKIIGADSLGYLPLEELENLVGHTNYCSACFDGKYPTQIFPDAKKDKFERKLSEK